MNTGQRRKVRLADVAKASSGVLRMAGFGVVVLGLSDGTAPREWMALGFETMCADLKGEVLLYGLIALLDKAGGWRQHRPESGLQIIVCFIEESPLYGVASAELEVSIDRLFTERWSNLALLGALIACQADVRVELMTRMRRKISARWEQAVLSKAPMILAGGYA